MKLDYEKIIKPFCAEKVERPWGHYGLYADNIKNTTKILFIKKGELLSLQYHFRRDQYYLILDDGFIIDYSDKQIPTKMINDPNEDRRIKAFNKFLDETMITVRANEGDMFGFKRRTLHRAAYIGRKEHGRVLDIAMGCNDENDIVRLKDKYNRK
jgi:hypothetical protein